MKRFRFPFGLILSVSSALWLIYLVNLPLTGPFGSRNLSHSRGDVAMAAFLFCIGMALILVDTFASNPRLEKAEEQENALREEILAMLPEAGESREELEVYIGKTLGTIGMYGLSVNELEHIKQHLHQKIRDKAVLS